MVQTATIVWQGRSGQGYRHELYPIGYPLPPAPAVYVFCRQDDDGSYQPVYVGQTTDLERLEHHPWWCIKSQGATHISFEAHPVMQARFAQEQDLIRKYAPSCNG